MMKLGYAGLNLIMGIVLQVIAVLGNYFIAVFSPHTFAVPGSCQAEQLTNKSYHSYRIIRNKMAELQMFA
jgi:hypothetical protein